jgi:excisionase family DNA binding protein
MGVSLALAAPHTLDGPPSLLVADDPWLSLQQAAKYVGVHHQTLRRAIAGGRLRAVRVNHARVIRLRRSWIDGWLEGGAEVRQ